MNTNTTSLDAVLSTVQLVKTASTREKQQLCLNRELRERLRLAATSRGMTVSGLVSRVLEALLPPLPVQKESTGETNEHI